MSTLWDFDQSHHGVLNTARGETIGRLLPELKQRLSLKKAHNFGCGLGHYAEILDQSDLETLAVVGQDFVRTQAFGYHASLSAARTCKCREWSSRPSFERQSPWCKSSLKLIWKTRLLS